MPAKRRRRITSVSVAVVVGIFLYTSPDAQHVAAFLIKAIIGFN